MTAVTIAISIFFIKTIDNPVYERWKEEREVTQQVKERQKEREQKFLIEEGEQDKEELEGIEEQEVGNKEPVF